MNKIQHLLEFGIKALEKKSILEARADAEVLLADVLSFERYKLYTNYDYVVPAEKVEFYNQLILKRAQNFPLCYLTEKKEFMGLEFKIKSGIFIPRQETEILVEKIADLVGSTFQSKNRIKIFDIGCGCGNIGISLAKIFQGQSFKNKSVVIYGIDINNISITCANENAIFHNVKETTEFYQVDIFNEEFPFLSKCDMEGIDIIISNPPYIKTDEIKKLQKEIYLYEPLQSIEGGKDGLYFYRKITKFVKFFLKKYGYLVVEIGYNQAESVKNIFLLEKFFLKDIYKDYSGIERVMIFKKYGQNNN